MVTNCDRKSFGSRRKNSKCCSDDWNRWRFWSAFRHFGTHFAESSRMSKYSWMMDQTGSCEMPSFSAIDLVEIRRSSKISSWIWSIISGKVSVLGRPERGASQVGKSPRLNWTPSFWQWHTMVDVPECFCQNGVYFLSLLALQGKKKILMRVRVSMLLKSRASPDMLPLSLCKKKTCNSVHEQTPLSNNTTNFFLRHREVVRAKDLLAAPRKCDNDFKIFTSTFSLWHWILHANKINDINTSIKVSSWMKLRKSHWG